MLENRGKTEIILKLGGERGGGGVHALLTYF